MYQLILNNEEYAEFKKMAKLELLKRDMNFTKLAEKTGYSVVSIYNFFSQKRNPSRFLAYAIADELKLKGVGISVKED